MQRLKLKNCKIGEIQEGAFNGLTQLNILDLSNNDLKVFDMQLIASSSPDLRNISLANNAIESLEDYNNTALPNLLELDISNNKLTYLPTSILDKLSEANDFIVNIESNTWECENENWAEYVTANNLTDILCPIIEETSLAVEEESPTTTEVVFQEPYTETTTLSTFFDISERSAPITNDTTIEESETTNMSLKNADLLPMWIILSIMGGIILGNSDRIWKWIQSKFRRNPNRRGRKCTLY